MIAGALVARPRMPGLGAIAALVALMLCSTAGTLDAQSPGSDRLMLWLGAGGAFPLAQPTINRQLGPGALAALELAVSRRLSVRAELSGNLQDLSTRADGPLSGDVQQGRTSIAARFAPVSISVVSPYALAGAGWYWQSDRVLLADISNPVPDATYRQTTSHGTVGTMLGVGASAPVASLLTFAEARWTRAGADGGAITDISFVAGVRLPIGR